MDSVMTWPCWEIMHCSQKEQCPAWHQAPTPCWEIARAADDYRKAMNVCPDCVVYVINQGESILTKEELKGIVAHKNACVLNSGFSQAAIS
ncbi:MAG: hypothetical protein KKB30_03040 [Proteobacteria bacterium]|nr:hypothetical protein [Pseudomonadota bacterium]MBU1716077.1 hypothetical protein [Pseudomonadota bacterium]